MAALPWLVRARLCLPPRLCLHTRHVFAPSPAAVEIESTPYPTERPDPAVFEALSDEYSAASSTHQFTPLTSAETLASLVARADFDAAESLRKELASHHVPIPCNRLYLRAALHAITERRPRGSSKRTDAFEAWLSLVPDRHEDRQSFYHIRHRLFCSMDHLNLALVYRFGLVLARKGYASDSAAMQVVSTLARYARPSVVAAYLRQVEKASQVYYVRTNSVYPSDLLAGAYGLAIRTVALAGKNDAALGLVSVAQSRRILVSDFTLDIVAKHASDQQSAIDRIQTAYPCWTPGDIAAHSVSQCETGPCDDVAALAVRLRTLRTAMRSPSPPPPAALHSFITSCQVLGRTRALMLFRSLALRHSPKSASTWVFTEMLHYRSRQQPIHALFCFFRHFHLVGVPRKTLLSLLRGTRGQQARKERTQPPLAIKEKLWPSAHHTALVWDAIVSLSSKTDKERLYALLLSLVRKRRDVDRTDEPRVELPANAFDAAHFSPFVSSWARSRPRRAAGVLRDMVQLGVEPSIVQWSMVARGYAQHDDPLVALRVLDRLEELDAGGARAPSDALLGAHTNVLRGFVVAGDVAHAREVERRLVERMGYRAGDRHVTDACLVLLRGLEDKLGHGRSWSGRS